MNTKNTRALRQRWPDLVEAIHAGARVDGPHEQISSLPLRHPAALASGQGHLHMGSVFHLCMKQKTGYCRLKNTEP